MISWFMGPTKADSETKILGANTVVCLGSGSRKNGEQVGKPEREMRKTIPWSIKEGPAVGN